MLTLAFSMVAYIRAFFLPRHQLALEAAALRQQLAVFKRKQTHPRLHHIDRCFWTALRRVYSGWAEALIIVKPETVVSWHRAGFRWFWRWRSRQRRPGRPKVSGEIRQLIRRMKAENPTWGAPRIHGELLQLGFTIAEPTVSRYLQQLKRHPDEGKAMQWLAFLNNHREVIAAFDLFTVSSLTFRTLYCFLSSRTAGGESCTSMSRPTRRAIGSCNNYARLFRFPAPTGTSYSTVMANSAAMFSSS
jgi:putative transposase